MPEGHGLSARDTRIVYSRSKRSRAGSSVTHGNEACGGGLPYVFKLAPFELQIKFGPPLAEGTMQPSAERWLII